MVQITLIKKSLPIPNLRATAGEEWKGSTTSDSGEAGRRAEEGHVVTHPEEGQRNRAE